MTLSFENMTAELNIFHTSSQPPVMDDHEEVNMIYIRSVTPLRSLIMKIPWRMLGIFSIEFDIEESIKEVNALLDSIPVMYTTPWKPKV